MVRSREDAAKAAEASKGARYPVGMCQAWTRGIFLAPAAGDRDGDGDADAVDGWKSEPESAREPGDRNPPRGVPVSWSGGRSGYGHRAVSLGNGMIASTDAPTSGVIGIVPLDWVEKNWGMTYLGWSSTITGLEIPGAPKVMPRPDPKPKPKVKNNVTKGRELLKKAMKWSARNDKPVRASKLKKALGLAPKE